ncbi:unnamed protein product [Lymnaea stagnalis]|uniref:Large ribosomal subunit protein bL32m n=1 Tax=Lymnaea stagnalis TaxID=6523 RepID=A0AAV2HR79_LYMST
MATSLKTFVTSFVGKLNLSLNNLRAVIYLINGNHPPPAFAVTGCYTDLTASQKDNLDQNSAKSLLDSIFDGILLAVPKHRRSLEKRLFRKHRFTNFMEYATPKTTIVPCLECGNFREKGHLCKHCYEKVQLETKEMQAKMGDDLQFNVPRQEVEIVYAGESGSDGKFVVNMEKQRPSWFPKNLLNKTGS